MKLADITTMIEMARPPRDPFNGATHLILANDVFVALAPHLEEYGRNPLVRPALNIEVRPMMPGGYGIGFRPWREGDDAFAAISGETMVWFLGPKREAAS